MGAAYEQHKRDVLAVAAAVLGHGRADAAWDVCHDVFVALARTAAALAPETDLRAYLTRAAANRARDRLAKLAPASGADEAIAGAASAQRGIHELIERDEEAAELWQVVAVLPVEQRLVVSLHVFGDLSFREIAAQEGISENTAQSRWRYALEKLRRHYEVKS